MISIMNESKDGLTIFVKKNKLNYINEFISLKCAPDLLAMKLFPNAKEITESMAMYHAIKKYVPHSVENFGNNNFASVFVVGDGSTPRTGTLVAFRTNWNVTSIDPNLKIKSRYTGIKRLTLSTERVGVAKFKAEIPVIIVMPHAHVRISEVNFSFPAGKIMAIISMPCCNTDKNLDWAKVKYEDDKVFSPERRIGVWTR